MAKPGRPAGSGKKSSAIMIRMAPDLREALDKAAKADGCTMTAEVERRLRATFDPLTEKTWADGIELALASTPQSYGLLLLIADLVDRVQVTCIGTWHKDAFARQKVREAIMLVLDALLPEPAEGMPAPQPKKGSTAWALGLDPALSNFVSAVEQVLQKPETIRGMLRDDVPYWPAPSGTTLRYVAIHEKLGKELVHELALSLHRKWPQNRTE